ncbi:response regulator transcription factor [Treponema zioleckii]|uniref:response regulator transcription factor n=1 Tax=Treponema zioleckii TaxID=331680 RepID=UPI00168BBCC0|nr:response regulator transcription factor [Treponema zioleckii]
MQSALKILFIDDHKSLRDGLGLLLSSRNPDFSFLFASNLEEAKEILDTEEKIDLAVLDLNLDGEDGLGVVTVIRAKKGSVPIIVYSMYADERRIEKALEYGVQGYITKNDGTDELESAIKIVANGGLCYSMAASLVIQKKLFGSSDVKADDKKDGDFYKRYMELSKSEQEVFALLAQKKKTDEIAKALGKKEKTVINQRTMIYQKLYLSDQLELIDYAKKLGVIV